MSVVPRPEGARPGRPAPWSGLPPQSRQVTLAQVRAGLAARAGRAGRARPSRSPLPVVPAELPDRGDPRPAAVLCLLSDDGGAAHVLLTKRSAHLRSHAGEVSFPGGRLGAGELPLHAALREANEEVGLDSAKVEILGELSPLTTLRSSALVYCFVGTFPGPGVENNVLRGDASEVERVFWAPLSQLLAREVFHEELWPVALDAAGTNVAYRAVPFFNLGDDVVWGATGRLLYELLIASLSLESAGSAPEGTLVGK